MWPLQRQQQNYHSVAEDDILDESQFPSSTEKPTQLRSASLWTAPLAVRVPLLLLGGLGFLALMGSLAHHNRNASTSSIAHESSVVSEVPTPEVTQTIPILPVVEMTDTNHEDDHQSRCPKRKEWRTLTRKEQQAYIDATLCLRTLYPANQDLDNNYTGYDDFPWIDAHHGYITHGMASYLPWHRWFLHLYEKALRNRCGYSGSLVYWDWTLDYEDFTQSPVLDPITGFGGDGEAGGEVVTGATGRCVVDGPFAGIQAEFWNGEVFRHCLSRGFRALHTNGGNILPDSVEYILSAPTYEDFVQEMVLRVRDVIPYSIGGEFEASTASYDPLFFLHFTQLDRLWWTWQQRQPRSGLFSYGGQKQPDSFEPASLDDELSFGGLGKAVKVKDVMNTDKKVLCYQY